MKDVDSGGAHLDFDDDCDHAIVVEFYPAAAVELHPDAVEYFHPVAVEEFQHAGILKFHSAADFRPAALEEVYTAAAVVQFLVSAFHS